MTNVEFDNQLNEWKQKVINAFNVFHMENDNTAFTRVMIDCFAMVSDVDCIIAKAFDCEPVLKGEK